MNETPLAPVAPQDFSPFCQKILSRAKQMFQSNPDWVTFFRENLGAGSMARKLFKASGDYLAFERTPEYQEIQRLVNQLRNRKISPTAVNEPTRVITVRLPESLHEALRLEADDHATSINKLCISKLLQVLDDMPKNSKPAGAMPARMPATTTNAQSNQLAPAPAGNLGSTNNPNSATGQPTHPMQPTMSAPPNFRSTYTPHGNH